MGNNAPHLCGTIRGMASACQYLYATSKSEERDLITGRKLQPFTAYCTRGGKIKKLGNLSVWTGLTPKSCPRRIAWEGTGGSDEEAEHGHKS